MFRTTLLASALVIGVAAGGAAQAEGLADGQDTMLAQAMPGTNLVGGGEARMHGGGSDRSITRMEQGPAQAGRMARLVAQGDGPGVVYLDPVPQPTQAATAGMPSRPRG
jgi:hypothetical protein